MNDKLLFKMGLNLLLYSISEDFLDILKQLMYRSAETELQ